MKDRYEIERELGRGGMGAVFLAHDRLLDRAVALKVIQGTAGKQEVERFVREARATGALDHPAFVPTYTLNRDGSNLFFTMEPVEGKTLASLLASGKLPPRDAVRALADVARGVAYAHERGLVHRDLKPGNVMIGPAGDVRILDWGLVRLQASGFRLQKKQEEEEKKSAQGEAALTAAGSVMGTPAYMSPEQAAGDLDAIGPATDVYALGAILYEILAGSPPHQGSFPEIARKLSRGDLEPPSSRARGRPVPRELEAVTIKAMARDPASRYESASAVAQDLQAWLEGRNVSVLLPPLPVRAARWVARHRLVSTAIALGVVLVPGVALAVHHRVRLEEARREAVEESERADRLREIRAIEERAIAASDRANDATSAWERAFDTWRDSRLQEEMILASTPDLPPMETGESLADFRRRTLGAMADYPWDSQESIVASREKGQALAPDSSAALEIPLREARDELELAVSMAERAWRRLLAAKDRPGATLDEELETHPESSLARLAVARADAEFSEATLVEEESIDPATLAGAASTALWERDPQSTPPAWRRSIRSLERLFSTGPHSDVEAFLATSRRILAGRERVRIGSMPAGCSGALYRLTGEPLWARPGGNGGLVEDDLAGLEFVATIAATGYDSELPIGEYLLVLSRGDKEVRLPFLLLRMNAYEIEPGFPDDFPAGTLYVPPGRFLAGGPAFESLPRHRSATTDGFFLQECEVTIAEYAEFMAALLDEGPLELVNACMPAVQYVDRVDPLFERKPDGGLRFTDATVDWDHPIFGVSYFGAAAYARWRTEKDPRGRLWRLPTTQEWEYAAGGPAGRLYPWGGVFEKERLMCEVSRGEGFFAPVRSFPQGRSVFGIRHMAGNSREWVASPCWKNSVVTRGGSWNSEEAATRVASRTGLVPDFPGAGLRLVSVPR